MNGQENSNLAPPRLDDFIDLSTLRFLLSSNWKKLLVIGAADTGKTTFIKLLANRLSLKEEIGIVDLDIGQSHIGPPTTVGWGTLKGGFKGWDKIKLRDFYFTGAISPVGNLLPVLTGSGIILRNAESKSRKLLIDTTGLISEPHGRVLKQNKIELIEPDLIVLFEKKDELEEIVSPFVYRSDMKIIRFTVPENNRLKTQNNRSDYRNRLFANYFLYSEVVDFDINRIGIKFTRNRIDVFSPYINGRIVSLRDNTGRDIALGVVVLADENRSKIFVKTQLKFKERVTSIVVGTVCME